MQLSSFGRACAGAAVTLLVGCTASTSSSEPVVEVASDELRVLSQTEIVGDLQYGQTSGSVSYSENPLYRAFRFQGKAGDTVDAWVRSTSGDARAWLLDGSFQNLATNDNASATTTDSHLVTTLKHGGAYYVAFREATREDASFTVSLQGTGASPTCDPEEEHCPDEGGGGAADPFDSASCSGPPITVAEAERWFPFGETYVPVSTPVEYIQKRTCVQRSTGPECMPWTNAGTGEQRNLVFTQSGKEVYAGLDGRETWSSLRGRVGAGSWTSGTVGRCSVAGSTTQARCDNEASTYIFNKYPSVTLTRNCVRASEFSYSSATTGATTWYERRGVILGRFNPR